MSDPELQSEFISKPESGSLRIAVIGLGYVGLPLAVEFGRRLPTLSYDIDQRGWPSFAAEKDAGAF